MAKLPEILEAERLQLRRCRPEHLDPVLLAIEVSVSELALWLPWADPMPTRASLEAFVHDRQADFDADQEWAYFMFETDTDELVGTIALHRRSDATSPRSDIGCVPIERDGGTRPQPPVLSRS